MALTGIVQRRNTKAVLIADPPYIGEIVFAYDTEEFGTIINDELIWRDFLDEVSSVSGKIGDVLLDKTDVGLDLVDNTSDIDKPVSTATQTALNLLSVGTSTHSTRVDNPHNVTALQIGLGNVDDTADIDKPISIAVSNALLTKLDNSATAVNSILFNNHDESYFALSASTYTKTEIDTITTDLIDLNWINTRLDSKADKTYVDAELLTKATTDQLNYELSVLRNEVSVSEGALSDRINVLDTTKATIELVNLRYTDTLSKIDANTVLIDNNTTLKADITYVDNQIASNLSASADRTYVDSQDVILQSQITTNLNSIVALQGSYVNQTDFNAAILNLDSTKTDLSVYNTRVSNVNAYIASNDIDIEDIFTELGRLSAVKADLSYIEGITTGLQNTKVDKSVYNVFESNTNNTLGIHTLQISDLQLVKADLSYVDTQDNALDLRVTTNETNINTLQTAKADLSYVTASLTTLTNVMNTEDANLQTQIDTNDADILSLQTNKADKSYVDSQDVAIQTQITSNDADILALQTNKADINYVNTQDTSLQTQITSNDSDIANLYSVKADLTYVDNLITGLDSKASVKVASTINIILSGLQSIDGYTTLEGDRVLVKDQTNATENGIYDASANAWIRSSDADNTPANEVSGGMFAFVENGTTNASTGWVLSSPKDNAVLGTDNLVFAQFSDTTLNANDVLTKLKTVDGSGSGLDADLLDGLDSTNFNQTHGTSVDAITTGPTILKNIYVTDGVIQLMETRDLALADLGYTGETNATADQTPAELLLAIKTVDGTGSGLDADLLDGLDSTSFNQTHGINLTVLAPTADVIDGITVLDGVVQSMTKRTMTLADLGYTGETNATADQTPAELLLAIKTVDGSGSGLDADLLDGQSSSFYTNATNISAGTISDAYLPASISSNTTGNAGTATALETARTISLSGDVSGSISFDATSDVSIISTVADNSHNHLAANITDLAPLLTAKLDANAKAVDSNLLDSHDSTYFATASHLHDDRYLRTDTSSSPTVTNAYALGSAALVFSEVHATTFYGTATAAQLADLAEMYACRTIAAPGTVMMIAQDEHDVEAFKGAESLPFGVVSDKPGFILDNTLEGAVPIALAGKTPVLVNGPIHKGDILMVDLDNVGYAKKGTISTLHLHIIGRALETKVTDEVALVKCAVRFI